MKTLVPGLQDHLDGRATTMCHCWRITRRDGLVQGFTDHDEDVVFAPGMVFDFTTGTFVVYTDATTFVAETGFTATQVQHSLGLAVDNLNVEGALSSDTINEDDLAAGKYDDAFVELFWVNWKDPTQRLVKQTGFTGETQRTGLAFSAELRGLSSRMGQTLTRTYQRTCDAVVGDARCGVNLNTSTYKGTGEVSVAVSPRVLRATGLGAYASSWFDQGVLTFTSGPCSGISIDVKSHTVDSGVVTLELWSPPAFDLAVGWDFTVTAGCQLTAEMCKARFNNIVNFRGFNKMPGNDAVIRNPDPSASNSGSSITSSSK